MRASRGARTFPGEASENYWFRRHLAAYLVALRLLRSRGTGPILEVGCGEGYGVDVLRGAERVVAMDLDPVAAIRASRAHAPADVVQADACRLPFAPCSFRAVVALQLLEHLYCPAQFVEAAGALLRPGGILVVATPNRETSADGLPNPFHLHEYVAAELGGLLQAFFERVRVGGIHSRPVLRALDRPAGGSFHHTLARTPFAELPLVLRLAGRAVRARHFRLGPPSGSLDLIAVAERPRLGRVLSA